MTYLSAVAPFGFPHYAETNRILSWFAGLGCTRCQYYRPRGHHDNFTAVRQAVGVAGFTIEAMHGHFGRELDISVPDEAARRQAVAAFRAEAEITPVLGARIVIVHPSWCAQTPQGQAPQDRKGRQTDEPDRVASLERSLCELAALGADLNVTFAVENLPPWFPAGGNAIELARRIHALGSQHLRMCFDTGHAHIQACCEPASRSSSVVNMLSECIDRDVIAYMHVHDNNGLADTHQVPEDGTIDWPAVGACLSAAHNDLPCMLELFMRPDELAALERCDTGSLRSNLERACGVTGAN